MAIASPTESSSSPTSGYIVMSSLSKKGSRKIELVSRMLKDSTREQRKPCIRKLWQASSPLSTNVPEDSSMVSAILPLELNLIVLGFSEFFISIIFY
jgi:hypothetical protein